MGRPRKPIAQLKAQGTHNVTRQNREEPDGTGKPVPPAGLSPPACTVWLEIIHYLSEMDICRTQDSIGIGALCELVAQHRYNCKQLARNRYDRDSQIAWRESHAELMRTIDRFAMSPAGRAKLGAPIEKKEPESAFDSLKVV